MHALLALALASAARLPADVVPHHYDLAFDVDPAKGTFSGTVDIDVEVRAPVEEVVLHAVDLTLSGAAVSQRGATAHPAVSARPADETVALAAPLQRGDARIHLAFSAPLRQDLRGLYLAKTKSGEAWAATQFEPTDARKAFPCFDEPALKATFSVRAHVPAKLSAVSNGPVTGDRADPAGHTLEFGATPPISSYLVALAVGNFGVLEGKAGAVPVRVVAPKGQEQLGRFALETAEKVIPWYERYTGMAYPFAKLDMVVIPEFEVSGMENAGAIFYRDMALLMDQANASLAQQRRVEEVVAHEIAHQWFGDLVTMQWWDDLWLNESFASVMEYLCVRDLRPDWPVRQELTAAVAHAKLTDSLRGTHAVHSAVRDPVEANAQFDEITYIKGEGVLAMLAHFEGDRVWQAGLHRYLAAHAYGNARAEDLWDAEGEASGKPIASMAQSWIGQAGLPVVSLPAGSRATAKDGMPQQRRFTLSPTPDDGQRWEIPLCVEAEPSEGTRCSVLEPSAPGTPGTPGTPGKSGGLVGFANAGGVGFYRVAYSPAALKDLLAPLHTLSLSPEERIALLADQQALALAGDPVTPLLDEIDALGSDRDATVLGAITGIVRTLGESVVADADRGRFQAWLRRQLEPVAGELGWEPKPGEAPERAEERAIVLAALDRVAGDPAVAPEAERRLAASENGGAPLDPTLRDTVFAVAARHGDQARWNDFRARMLATDEPGVRFGYLQALASFRDPALLEQTLGLTTDGTIAVQNVGYAFRALFANPDARAPTWRYFKANFDAVRAKLPPILLNRLFVGGLSGFCSAEDHDDVAAFFEAHRLPGIERPLDRALETIDVCARAKRREQRELHKWLGVHAARVSASKPTAGR